MEQVLVAAVTIIPSTIVSVAAWRQSAKGRAHAEATRDIVTGNGHGSVTTIAESTSALTVEVLERLTLIDGRLTNILRWQGDHQADHDRRRA